MELLYGGTARRIGYEGGRAQNRARIEPGALGMTIAHRMERSAAGEGPKFSLAPWLLASRSSARTLSRRSSIKLGDSKGFASLAR